MADALKRSAEDAYEKLRDEEQARLAKKHKKQHKRDESLVEIHQKKLRKEQRERVCFLIVYGYFSSLICCIN